MRKLMIKLVAFETALVGWLSYWLFLVYANNPTVAQGLAAQLSRFPQLSFTTIDITVLVIIGVLSIFLAFKFQRGLKPGIRLERALQMLENLMKRNLILEAQVAEMKLEKAQVTTLPPMQANPEGRTGSWEKVFRTPIEAGLASPAGQGQSNRIIAPIPVGKDLDHDTPNVRASGQKPEPRTIVSTVPAFATEDLFDKPMDQATPSIENSTEKTPSLTSVSPGIPGRDEPGKLSREPRSFPVQTLPGTKPGLSSPDSFAFKQPYIPAPAPKSVPSSVLVGPGSSSMPQFKPQGSPPPAARFTASPTSGQKSARHTSNLQQGIPDPSATTVPPVSETEITRSSPIANASSDVTVKASKDSSEKPAKTTKSSSTRKRFPWEDS